MFFSVIRTNNFFFANSRLLCILLSQKKNRTNTQHFSSNARPFHIINTPPIAAPIILSPVSKNTQSTQNICKRLETGVNRSTQNFPLHSAEVDFGFDIKAGVSYRHDSV